MFDSRDHSFMEFMYFQAFFFFFHNFFLFFFFYLLFNILFSVDVFPFREINRFFLCICYMFDIVLKMSMYGLTSNVTTHGTFTKKKNHNK